MLWLKSLHIIFMVAWYAGLLYLPRLFVYHATAEDQASLDRFVVMEKKLFAIMSIGALGTLIFGMLLVGMLWGVYGDATWLYIKLALVLLLMGFHIHCWFIIKKFANRQNTRTHTFYRFFNEFPALVLIAIVILVVVKPL